MFTNIYFDEQLKAVQSDFERADEFIRGIEWVLARDAESGTCVDRVANIWFIPLIDIFRQAMGAFYTFDDEKVYMLSIRMEDGDV